MILVGVDLGVQGAACLVECKRGEAPRLRDYFRWSDWTVTSVMAGLTKWIDLYPNAQIGFERIFAMPGRARVANSQFRLAMQLLRELVKLGLNPVEVKPQGADEAENARRIFSLSSPAFRDLLNTKGATHLLDSLAIALALEGELQAAKFEKKLEKAKPYRTGKQ